MYIQLLISILVCFVLFLGLIVFYARHQARVPYYRFDQKQSVNLLTKAVNGELLEQEWHVFIGMSIRDDKEIEVLREQCCLLDETCVKGTQLISGKTYVLFTQEGLLQLKKLLDEWKHKTHYMA